jgi:hypothetical protein
MMINVDRTCHACGSSTTNLNGSKYHASSWYLNRGTDLVLCSNCNIWLERLKHPAKQTQQNQANYCKTREKRRQQEQNVEGRYYRYTTHYLNRYGPDCKCLTLEQYIAADCIKECGICGELLPRFRLKLKIIKKI